MKLDAEERAILKSVERGEWRPAKGSKRNLGQYARYAKQRCARTAASAALLVRQRELDVNLGIRFDGLPVELIGLIAPASYSVHGRWDQQGRAA